MEDPGQIGVSRLLQGSRQRRQRFFGIGSGVSPLALSLMNYDLVDLALCGVGHALPVSGDDS
jgi:hypothetical protein